MALRAFVWVICVGCERVRVVVLEGKALVRYWWHAGKFVDDFRAARCRAARCGTQTRIHERLSSPCIAAYGQHENTVALGFVEGLNNTIREILRHCDGLRDEEYRRRKILTCTLPPLPHDHNA